jgi:putative lipoic acid-binding regulatory protein
LDTTGVGKQNIDEINNFFYNNPEGILDFNYTVRYKVVGQENDKIDNIIITLVTNFQSNKNSHDYNLALTSPLL